MNIHIVLIAYGLPEETKRLLACKPASKKNKFHWHLFLHSKIDAVVSVCEAAAKRRNVTYYPYGENRGLAKSWNEGILAGYAAGADMVIVSNDDILPSDGDLEALATAAIERCAIGDLVYVVDGTCFDVQKDKITTSEFGCFAITPLALETIGMFDEQFFPIYWEDVDYGYRARISGLKIFTVADTYIVHTGSATIERVASLMDQHHFTFVANQNYYKRKWGGTQGKETYKKPFNDLRFSTRIAPCDRDRPYWGYERHDQALVEL